MNSDAMNAGVNPGGLNSRTQIRILICYILNNIKQPVPLEPVKEQLHFNGIANYYETAFAISELLENKNIVPVKIENGITYYTSSDEGKKVSDVLSNDVPFTVKERSLEIAQSVINRIKNEREHKFEKQACENGFYVTCSVMEKNMVLASITLLVPDNDSAETVKNNFLDSPMKVLINATNGLLGETI